MSQSSAKANVDASHLAPVPKAVDPLFLAVSVEWMMDASIPIEIRILCQMIAAKALTEARSAGRDFTDFGREPVTTKITREWIMENTGWPKGRSESVRAEAVEAGYLSVSGSSRNGFDYTVTMPLRTHRAPSDVPSARSLFAEDRVAPKPAPSPQLQLAEVADAATAPPDMRKWSRADREFYARSSGAIKAVFARLSGADRKLFARLSGANQALYARTPGADSALLARLSGGDDELSARRSGAKRGLYNVRARSQESGENSYQNLLAEVVTPEMRTQLLLLARKREEDTDEDSATFVKALSRIIATLDELCEHDLARMRQSLERVIHDERVTAHENPIALMLRGICNKPRFLLTTRYASKIGRTPEDRAFLLLPEPVQGILLDRVRDGLLTPDWCKQRDISEAAARAARVRVAAEAPPAPAATVAPRAPAAPSPEHRAPPAAAPGNTTSPVVQAPATDPAQPPPPAWWMPIDQVFQRRLSIGSYRAFFCALRPCDVDGVRTVVAPVEFTLQRLRHDLGGAELAEVLQELGCDVRVVVDGANA